MTSEKIYTNLSFCFEVEITGKCRKFSDKELSALHYEIKEKLEDYLLTFRCKQHPELEVNEIGIQDDYEQYYQVED